MTGSLDIIFSTVDSSLLLSEICSIRKEAIWGCVGSLNVLAMLSSDEDVLRFDRKEVVQNWGRLTEDVYYPARAARVVDGLYQDWNRYGGDEFLDKSGWIHEDRCPGRVKRLDFF